MSKQNDRDMCVAHDRKKTLYCLEHKKSMCTACSDDHVDQDNCDGAKSFVACKKDISNFLTNPENFMNDIRKKVEDTGKNLKEIFENNESKEDLVQTYKNVKRAMDYAEKAILYIGRKEAQVLEKANLHHAKFKLEEAHIMRKLKEYTELKKNFEDFKEDSKSSGKRNICEAFDTVPTLYDLKAEIEKWSRKSDARKKVKNLMNSIKGKSKNKKLKEIEEATIEYYERLKKICSDIPKTELEHKAFSKITTSNEESKAPPAEVAEDDEVTMAHSEYFGSSIISSKDSDYISESHTQISSSDGLSTVKEENKESQMFVYVDWSERTIYAMDTKKQASKKISIPEEVPSFAEYIQISDKEFIFAGGEDKHNKEVANCFKFNITDYSFTEVKKMNVPKTNHKLVKVDDDVYSLGGSTTSYSESADLDIVEIFNGKNWELGPKMCVKAQGLAAAYMNNLYTFGGRSESDFITFVQVLSSGQWNKIHLSMSEEVEWSIALPLNNSILLFGANKEIWKFNTSIEEVTKKEDTTLDESCIDRSSAAIINGNVYIVGTGDMNLLILSNDEWEKVRKEKWMCDTTTPKRTRTGYLVKVGLDD